VRLVLDRSAAVAAWVAARIPQLESAADFGACMAIGVEGADGSPLGGVVFHNWQPRFGSVEASFASASPRWLSRRIILGIMAYPFGQLGCRRLTAVTPKRAREARAFLDAFGFKREGVIRQGFGADDAIVSGMLKREWERSRWARDAPG